MSSDSTGDVGDKGFTPTAEFDGTSLENRTKRDDPAQPQDVQKGTNSVSSRETMTTRTNISGKDRVAAKSGSWFSIPPPLKRIFDKFPLVTYEENALPLRGPKERKSNTLYIFTSEKDAETARPSFNPSCLKWQTYLKIAGVTFTTRPSNNHASPTGSLPFFLIGTPMGVDESQTTPVSSSGEVVSGNKLKKWVKQPGIAAKLREPEDVRYEAYYSLLETSVRKAWLYQLYLHPANEAVVKRLYVEPCSSNPVVQMTICYQLRSAAEAEIIKSSAKSGSTSTIDETEIMRDAAEAFDALATLLGDDESFFCSPSNQQTSETIGDYPGLFDASVFAYTNLILDSGAADAASETMGWAVNPLKRSLEQHENLVRHRDRIVRMYY